MKESKGVYVTKRDIKENLLHREYQLYSNKIIAGVFDGPNYVQRSNDVGVQYNSKRDNVICTCRNLNGLRRHHEARYFNAMPKQIYTYHRSRSFTEIGVGSVKALQKKKVKRVYLPETDDKGVGSSDLSSLMGRKPKYTKGNGYYDTKRTSSKCVGGLLEIAVDGCISAKVSPIIHTKSGTTSPNGPTPKSSFTEKQNTEIGSNTIEKELVTTTTQIETNYVEEKIEEPRSVAKVVTPEPIVKKVSDEPKKESKKDEMTTKTSTEKKQPEKKFKEVKSFSSDSLVQHVHNLENPSEDKPNLIDPMENKLEREYRKIFDTKSREAKGSSMEKTVSKDFKSASLVRRRFEALKRTLGKKEDSGRNYALIMKSSKTSKTSKTSSQASVIVISKPSHRDASVTSDPPSLEGRSYSNTRAYRYTPYSSTNRNMLHPKDSYKKSYTGKKEYNSNPWSRTNAIDSEYGQGVKGMFKLWGKKFNLDEDYYRKNGSPKTSFEEEKKVEIKELDTQAEEKPLSEEKKEGKKFFFFKKKNKDKDKETKEKPKEAYPNNKQKKGVTAGRCEVRDGLTIKIGAAIPPSTPPPTNKIKKKIEKPPESRSEILRKAWLMKYLTNPTESRNSVQVRWNNYTYNTSSSTVFELMENVYKDTGVVFKSKSELLTAESSYYKSYTKQNVNFVQNVQAWMVPKMVPDNPLVVVDNAEVAIANNKTKNMEVTISDQKWLIEKSKAFAHKIEVVLHSKNIIELNNTDSNSEYLKINIPKGFFSDTSSDEPQPEQTSDEEVYKIVEYETIKSSFDLKKIKKKECETDAGDNMYKDIKVTISVKDSKNESKILETIIKRPPMHRDVVTQGSTVYIPKKCDVIGVGIITQRDVREVKKPILKFVEYESDDDSERSLHSVPKKCEFAESYLQDYYRNWTPLGIDLFSWCVSDSHVKCCSENTSRTNLNNGDATKSCPDMFDEYTTSPPISSCPNSSCSQCLAVETEIAMEKDKTKSKGKDKKESKESKKNAEDKRVLPKDSLEVLKKRKLYAKSNKAQWKCCNDKPYSVPSFDDKGAPDGSAECPKKKPGNKRKDVRHKGGCGKHVSLPDCDLLGKNGSDSIPGILTFKGSSACDSCKKKGLECPKRVQLTDDEPCEIPDAKCRSFCLSDPKPACIQKGAKPCTSSSTPPCCPICKPKAESPPCPASPKKASPRSSSCPPCEGNSPSSPKCPGRSPPRSPPCPPKSPPCPPKSPPCPPKSPPCPPKSPPCPPKSPPCPPKSPPCPPKSPPCPPKSPPCPPKSPPCPGKSPPRSPPCPTKAGKALSFFKRDRGRSKSPRPKSPNRGASPPCPPKPGCPVCQKSSSGSTPSPKQSRCKQTSPPGSPRAKQQPSCCSRPGLPPCAGSDKSPSPKQKSSCCQLPQCPLSPPRTPKTPCCETLGCPPCNQPPAPSSCDQSPSLSPPRSPPCPKSEPKTRKDKSSCSSSSSMQSNAPNDRCFPGEPCAPSCGGPTPKSLTPPKPSPLKRPCAPKPAPCFQPKKPNNPPKCSPKPSPPKCPPKPSPPKCSPKPSPPKCPPKPSPPKCSPKPSPPKCSPKPSPPKCSPKPSPPKCPLTPSPPMSPQRSSSSESSEGSPARCCSAPTTNITKPKVACVASAETTFRDRASGCSPAKPNPHRLMCESCKPKPKCGGPPAKCGAPPPKCDPPQPPPFEQNSQCGVQYPTVEPPQKITKPTRCNLEPCSKVPDPKPRPVKPPPVRCSTPPCRPLPDGIPSPPVPTGPPCRPKEECIPKCPLTTHPAEPKKEHKSEPKIPDCIKGRTKPNIKECPPAPPPTLRTIPSQPQQEECPKACRTRSKITGIYLKKLPSKKKTCSRDCMAWDEIGQPNVIQLNSQERITIRLRDGSPSTHEIREPLTARIRNESGKTICERKDYVAGQVETEGVNLSHSWCKQGSAENTPLISGVYKGSPMNRMNAPVTINNVKSMERSSEEIDDEEMKSKSDVSIANLIEINFKLRVSQGDKMTEINIGNDQEKEKNKADNKCNLGKTSQEVFVLKDDSQSSPVEEPKNDINIRILIKNYKPEKKKKIDKKVKKSHGDEFADKISAKFQTVSTGYDCIDFSDEKHETSHVFSVHRATIDLTASPEISKTHLEQSATSTVGKSKSDYISTTEKTNSSIQEPCILLSQEVTEVRKLDIDKVFEFVKPKKDSEDKIQKLFERRKSGARFSATDTEELEPYNNAGKHKDLDTKSSVEQGEVGDKTSDKPIDLKPSEDPVDACDKNREEPLETCNEKIEDQTNTLNKKSKPTILCNKTCYEFADLDNKTSEEQTDARQKDTSDEQDTDVMVHSSEEKSDSKEYSKMSRKEEKKEMLKQVFENANYLKKPKTKTRIQKLKNILKAILTSDSSDPDDIVVPSNELAKDITYECLKPNFFKNSDSLNNYYRTESTVESQKCSNIRLKHPSIEINSLCSAKSDEWSEETKSSPGGCLCSALATRLNINNTEEGGGCCCRKKITKTDQETICDIRNEDDYFLLNYNSAEYVDVEVQNSTCLSSRINCANMSITSKTGSLNSKTESIRSKSAYVHTTTESIHSKTASLQSKTESIRSKTVSLHSKTASSSSKPESNNSKDLSSEGKEYETKPLSTLVENAPDLIIKQALEEPRNIGKRKKTFSPRPSHIKECEMKKLNTSTKLGINDEDKIVFLETKTNKQSLISRSSIKYDNYGHKNKSNFIRPTDVLQLYETKKAVLEIYAEKTETEDGEHLVAKLPKFTYDREHEICRNYEKIVNSTYKTLCKRNLFMMSIRQ